MTPEELRTRTQAFALRIIKLVATFPHDPALQVIGRQLLRSGTSVGANYRAACRAGSRADFAAKLAIVEEEADETLYWLELLTKSALVKADPLGKLMAEANELVAIITAARKTIQKGG
jgi:four helix bundle protein